VIFAMPISLAGHGIPDWRALSLGAALPLGSPAVDAYSRRLADGC
jgi:hypothetical protein